MPSTAAPWRCSTPTTARCWPRWPRRARPTSTGPSRQPRPPPRAGGTTPAAERGRLLLRLADLIEERTDELATLESTDTGHPVKDSRGLDVPRTAGCFRYFGGMADKLQGDVIPVEKGFLNYVVREPLGVVGQIVPWNFPLMFTSWKMGPRWPRATPSS